MKITLLVSVCAAAIFACGGDGSPTTDAPTATTDALGTQPPDAPIGGGPADANSADAENTAQYCIDYEAKCGYGTPPNRFANTTACETTFSATCAARQECMMTHLGLVDTADQSSIDTHCPHATGQAPCGPTLCI